MGETAGRQAISSVATFIENESCCCLARVLSSVARARRALSAEGARCAGDPCRRGPRHRAFTVASVAAGRWGPATGENFFRSENTAGRREGEGPRREMFRRKGGSSADVHDHLGRFSTQLTSRHGRLSSARSKANGDRQVEQMIRETVGNPWGADRYSAEERLALCGRHRYPAAVKGKNRGVSVSTTTE